MKPTPQRAWVVAGGKRLETLWFAPETANAPTLVLLHEGLGSIAHWKDFPRRLAERTGCGVLVYSRAGYGDSERLTEKRPVNYMHREAEVVLPTVLEQQSIRRPVLLGHSDGASIALIFAGTFPDAPRALILEAPHVFVEDLTVRSIAQAKTVYQTTDLPRRLGRYHAHGDDTFWGWNDIWLDPAFRSWNIEEYLPKICCPVLLIQGEDDEYGTLQQLEAIRARIPAAEILTLAQCGHTPHRDQTEATLERMAWFIASLNPASPQ
jgi:pimeloyl-ACP methyl ester carboxylesterase